MKNKVIITLVLILMIVLAFYLYSIAKKDASKLPPPETASGAASEYLPQKEEEKTNTNVRATGPVWMAPEKNK